ncbi:DUF4258 domain-containing protein [Bizionia argentinensis JUB59]|uniref:DUF4258 domain-containing protein n=1 Tax=Bizionia argentinensis JUB59 TaxID=1046627 RepID=G2E9C0_9FLAO|nr:DUF4258 domain-containing protein [Bizionia argentinensis]EGV44935.1 DUF4258 domain-containing protein [Bizionia argentinensis JUB59]
MKLLHRIGYYLGGFSIGLILLAFFLKGKNTSCDYGPESRVLKNINSKTLHISPSAEKEFQAHAIDSATIRQVLKYGDIHFSKSDTRKKPCGIYFLEGRTKEAELDLKIENCDSIATITEVIWK